MSKAKSTLSPSRTHATPTGDAAPPVSRFTETECSQNAQVLNTTWQYAVQAKAAKTKGRSAMTTRGRRGPRPTACRNNAGLKVRSASIRVKNAKPAKLDASSKRSLVMAANAAITKAA